MMGIIEGVSETPAEAQLTSVVSALPRWNGNAVAPAVEVIRATGFGVPVAVRGTVMTLSVFTYTLMALLIAVACANVAALVLARGVGRTREIAIRVSLGRRACRSIGAADTHTLLARYSFVPLLTFGTTNGARYSLRVNIAVASGSPLHVYVSGSKCNVRPVLYEMFAR
jgi:hypothetical protein